MVLPLTWYITAHFRFHHLATLDAAGLFFGRVPIVSFAFKSRTCSNYTHRRHCSLHNRPMIQIDCIISPFIRFFMLIDSVIDYTVKSIINNVLIYFFNNQKLIKVKVWEHGHFWLVSARLSLNRHYLFTYYFSEQFFFQIFFFV